jgi:putative Holliday junction resolvase
VLAIDPGTVRLGLALSDPSGIIAQPLMVLKRRSPGEDLAALHDLVRKLEVEVILIGLPRLMNGTLDVAARNAQEFGRQVGERTGLRVEYWDERLTSVAAERHLIAQGKRRDKRRAEIDRTAATLLLQGYLDYQAQRRQGG